MLVEFSLILFLIKPDLQIKFFIKMSFLSFQDLVGSEVRFDENGDGLGRYNLYNLQMGPAKRGEPEVFFYRRIGQWSEEGLSLDETLISWRASGLIIGDRPTSRCSDPCKSGQVKITQSSLEHCCWICQSCRPYQFVANESTCADCERGWWPNVNKTGDCPLLLSENFLNFEVPFICRILPLNPGCFELPLTYISWTSYFAILPIGLAVLGITLTLFVIITFMRHMDTPIVKASGKHVCDFEDTFFKLSHCFISNLY